MEARLDFLETVTQRNAAFAEDGFSSTLKIIPSTKTIIIGCLDPRVDPMDILGLQPGEAAIIRNIGGRINSALLETLVLLSIVTRAAGQEMGPGWNLVILHHTQCGIIGCYKHAPDLLAIHMGVARAELDKLAITDPHKAVALDVAALKANPDLPGGFMISGVVYDVVTGRIEIVVPPSLLREDASA
jgi:carbonic anhydrase